MPLNKKPDPAAAPAPEEKSKHGIWDIPLVRIIVAVFCAIITWFVVTMYFDQEGNVTVMVDEISYTYQASTYTSLGLDLVETPQTGNISVRVEGSTTVIGNITGSDIMVYPRYSTVRGAGEVTLDLAARFVSSDYDNFNIDLTVENPTNITVVFDEVSEKVLPVTADTSQIEIADGFSLNRVSPVPAEVTLTGPTSELEQVASVAAVVPAQSRLNDSVTLEAPLEGPVVEGGVGVGGHAPHAAPLFEELVGAGGVGQAVVDDLAVPPQALDGPHGGVGLELGPVVVGKVEGDQSGAHGAPS